MNVHTMTVAEAKADPQKFLDLVLSGDEVKLIEGGLTVADCNAPAYDPDTCEDLRVKPKGNPMDLHGLFEGQIYMSDDFDAPLDDMKEYM